MLERFDLRGRVVVLTGGAGKFGRGLSADLAAANATLVVASRSLEACEQVAEEERARGGDVYAMAYDQGDPASVEALARDVRERFGRVDGLVNNAVGRPMGADADPVEGWENSMRINADGIYHMHRVFGPLLTEGTGSLVNVASIQGMVGPTLSLYEGTGMSSGQPDYYFHKGGMLNMTRFYAALLGQRGVRVNCVSPGGFFADQPETFVERYNAQTFLGRMANESDLGGAVVFLLSDAAAYITAANLPVDGGYTAH